MKPGKPDPPCGGHTKSVAEAPAFAVGPIRPDRRTGPRAQVRPDEAANPRPEPAGRFYALSEPLPCEPWNGLREKTGPLLKHFPDRPGSVSPRERSWASRLQGFAPPEGRGASPCPISSHVVGQRRNAASTPEAWSPQEGGRSRPKPDPPQCPPGVRSPLRLSLPPPGRRLPASSSHVLAIPSRASGEPAPGPGWCTTESHLAAGRFLDRDRERSRAAPASLRSPTSSLPVAWSRPPPKEQPTRAPGTFGDGSPRRAAVSGAEPAIRGNAPSRSRARSPDRATEVA
jgi:hypothetical protein